MTTESSLDFYTDRVASLDTLDVGLSKEEDNANNVGAREEINRKKSPVLNGSSRVVQTIAISNQSTAEVLEGEGSVQNLSDSNFEEPNKKKAKLDHTEEEKNDVPVAVHRRILNRPKSAVNGVYSMAVARPVSSMKGHTAFLTFAVRPQL